MARVIMLKNSRTGLVKKGFVGFSWTTFIFGGFPALFRGDIVLGLVTIVLQWITLGISTFIWAFFYNKHYTIKLIEQGYELADSDGVNALARAKLGISEPTATA